MILLKTADAFVRFGGVTAVDNLNLTINEGEIVALIGPNGAGKTTAFNMITGVHPATEGRIELQCDGALVDITHMRPDLIAKKGIARTFQNICLFEDMTVLDNVLTATHMRVRSTLFEAVAGLPRYRKEERKAQQRAMELLERVGLAEHANDPATSLPYGKQRRLEIARALAAEPRLLLLDEPAAGMNPQETHSLTKFVREIRDDFRLTILLIEHHMQIVMDISDRIYVLDFGETIAEGTPDVVSENPRVIDAYLGVGDDD
ncbi:MAG: ABC transporter ATP-binding protein [Oscillospiraceae bacterium]